MSRHVLRTAFADLWAVAERRAAAAGQPILLSWSEPRELLDPIALFARSDETIRLLCYVPQDDTAIVGLGGCRLPIAVDSAAGTMPERLARVWRTAAAEALQEGPLAPLVFAGWAFDPHQHDDAADWASFGAAQLLVPRFVYRQQGTLAFQAMQAVVRPGETAPPSLPACPPLEPPVSRAERPRRVTRRDLVTPDDWQRMLRSALRAIDHGTLQKVVLARAVELVADRPFDPEGALRSLAERYPTCTLFAVAVGPSIFLGATPERLARVTAGTVTTVALAGSIPRGVDAASDRATVAALRASAKDRSEHELVVQAIEQALAPLCTRLSVPETPTVLSMANVHHLATPIVGVLRDGLGVLDVAARLHPTPAVGGTPREAALAFIRGHEPVPRGWYAGALGWVAASGDGELVVALRSGLLRGTTARLYAGCGIVAGSDPLTEWAEAEAKLRPMLEALTGS
ncbi:isochorismate synthase [Thermomicrobium sp. 4228-Ro]|uniref:isochorismate synthase n=1 Tax=Thermomicrobium sp. 4228-Ro TaxID=2993937 RepID=UPI00224905BA|nr:isochorismate synthase [Thermomicrobium sp. 4228-Ro]MCX2728263.1 isochorismate synthase [Thermomicrobium sp. 4228-Ro]